MTDSRDLRRRPSGDVVVHLPAELRLARLARAVAAAYGSELGMSVDDLADVRLLVDEVFHALLAVTSGPIVLRLGADGALRLEMSAVTTSDTRWPPRNDMTDVIATVLAARASFDHDGDHVVFRALITTSR